MDNPETLATLGKQDTGRKQTTRQTKQMSKKKSVTEIDE
jgi:hypothetical protein